MEKQKNYYYQGPAAEHSLLSPSGKMSKRARKDAERRELERLFPPEFLESLKPTAEQTKKKKVESLRNSARDLRNLAAAGMSSRKFRRKAAELELQATELEQL